MNHFMALSIAGNLPLQGRINTPFSLCALGYSARPTSSTLSLFTWADIIVACLRKKKMLSSRFIIFTPCLVFLQCKVFQCLHSEATILVVGFENVPRSTCPPCTGRIFIWG